MAVEVDVVYLGDLRCEATHGPSRSVLTTDAPVDNHGRGEAFSPTDLVATALATCVATTMGIVAQRNQLDVTGMRIHVTKEMVTDGVRRIGRLPVTVVIPAEKAQALSPDQRTKLEHAAHNCPVHRSLHPDIAAPIVVHYG